MMHPAPALTTAHDNRHDDTAAIAETASNTPSKCRTQRQAPSREWYTAQSPPKSRRSWYGAAVTLSRAVTLPATPVLSASGRPARGVAVLGGSRNW